MEEMLRRKNGRKLRWKGYEGIILHYAISTAKKRASKADHIKNFEGKK